MRAGTRGIRGSRRIAAAAVRRSAAAAVRCSAVALAAVAATALAAACGSASQQGASSAAASCPASGLRVTLDTSAAGAAAGTSYLPLDFTNTSKGSCRLDGYPAVAFVTGVSGRQIGSAGTRDRTVPAHQVTLAPGATAHAWLQLLAAANFPAQQCHPVTAGWLRVRLPGAAGYSFLRHPLPACASVVRGSHLLLVQPVEPGRARRGTA
jgi:Protein of unknown function (DUF4232)